MHVLYGSEPSFYTRKAWIGLRLLGLEVDDRPKSLAVKAEVEAAVNGYHRFPVVQCPDGRWLIDSTDLLVTLSEEHDSRSLLPGDPALDALNRVLDDWIDEWMIRPVILHRVAHPETRAWVAHRGGRALLGLRPQDPTPADHEERLARMGPKLEGFFANVGQVHAVGEATWPAVEALLHDTCAAFDAALAASPFLLGSRPSLADAALWGMLDAGLLWEPAVRERIAPRYPHLAAFHARLATAAGRGAEGGWDPAPVAAERLAPLLDGDALGFAPFLNANSAALAGEPPPTIDGHEVPPRPFTEKNRRRLGHLLGSLPPAALPDWPLLSTYTENPA